MPDETLQCRDCRKDFLFTEDEQRRFAEHDYAPPRRCRSCRAQQRARSAEPKTGDAAPSPAAPRPKPRPAGPMHDAVCSECASATQVPFVPDGVRPVFCLDCLKKRTR